MNQNTATTLYDELTGLERHGVSILMDGRYASPMQIVQAHMIREEGAYMRDYEINPAGFIEVVSFTDINRRERRG